MAAFKNNGILAYLISMTRDIVMLFDWSFGSLAVQPDKLIKLK